MTGVVHGMAGACVTGGGHAWQGRACVAGEMATAADGTHPTGMHSCLIEVHTDGLHFTLYSAICQ